MKVCITLTILAALTICQSSEALSPPQIGDGQNELLMTIKDVVLTTLGLIGRHGNNGDRILDGILGPTGSRSLKEPQDDSVAISGHEKLEEIEAIDAAAFRAYVVKKLVELVQAKRGASDSSTKANGVNITAPAENGTSATK